MAKAGQSSNILSSEKTIEHEILEFLARQKDVFCWKVNSVGVYDAASGVYRKPNSPFILTGVSDILGIHKSGKMIAIEVKKPKGSKISKEQEVFVDKINRMGGYACFARTVQEAKNFLETIRSQLNGSCGDKRESEAQMP